MKAARLHGAKDVRIEEAPTPEAGEGEALVRVRAVAICPSDWRLYDSGDAGGAPLREPIIQGHEFAGDVVALGEGVMDPPVGARVAVEPSWHCGHCDQCQKGRYNICRNVIFPSFPPHDGALAEYIACPAINVEALPGNVGYIEGALTEPLGVALHGVRLAAPSPQDSVLILGAGLIGLCAMLIAKLGGCEDVTVVEPVAGRRELARRLGAARVAASHEELLDEDFEAEIVLECSGFSGAVEEAMRLAAPAGRVIVVGIPHPERVEFEANLPRRRELTLVFSRRSRDTLGDAIELVASGKIDLKAIPVRRFRLEETQEAMEATAARPGDMLRAIVEV